MKRILLVFPFIISFSALMAGDSTYVRKGLFLSVGAGPDYGRVRNNLNYMKALGPSISFDFKGGFSLKNDLFFHATYLYKKMSGLDFYLDEKHDTKLPREFYVNERMLGMGLTYYSTNNFFASTSLGVGEFIAQESLSGVSTSSGMGFGFQIKIGKEWWLLRYLSLGIAFSYSKTSVSHMNVKEPIHQSIDSDRFSAFLNLSVLIF